MAENLPQRGFETGRDFSRAVKADQINGGLAPAGFRASAVSLLKPGISFFTLTLALTLAGCKPVGPEGLDLHVPGTYCHRSGHHGRFHPWWCDPGRWLTPC